MGLLLLLAMLAPPAAASVIGLAKTVVRQVDGITQSGLRRLKVEDNVYREEIIRTADHSATLLAFPDETEFMVGPNSEVTLDSFIFAPDRDRNRLHLRIKNGLLKFRTGTMPSQAYKVQSRVATIGVRGTEFAVHVRKDGTTYVFVMTGIVTLTDNFGRMVLVRKNESAVVYPDGTGPARYGPVHYTEIDPGLAEEVRRLVALLLLHDPAGFQSPDEMFGAPDRSGVNRNVFGNPARRTPRGPRRQAGAIIGPSLPLQPEIVRRLERGAAQPMRQDPDGDDPLFDPSPPGSGGGPIVPSDDGFLRNGDFEAGSLFWIATGAGVFDVVPRLGSDAGLVGRLTTGSPVTISNRLAATPEHAFAIAFDATFIDGVGILQVLLDERLIGTFDGSGAVGRQRFEITLFDPSFGALADVDLAFILDGTTSGIELLIDNVAIRDLQLPFSTGTAVPAPSSAVLTLAPVLAWTVFAARRQRIFSKAPFPRRVGALHLPRALTSPSPTGDDPWLQ